MSNLLAVGTQKGLFLFDRTDNGWNMRDPLLPEWESKSLLLDPADPDHIMVGTSHYAWGPTVRETTDGGKNWSQTSLREKSEEGDSKLTKIWQLQRSPHEKNVIYAGVADAALYRSDDAGKTWAEVEGLTKHPSRPHWQPGAGGLCLHTILFDPEWPKQMWVGISAVGVFKTEDAGESWHAMNDGLPKMTMTGSPDEDAMFCIHKMQLDPTEAGRIYMQFHAHTMTPDKSRSSGVFICEAGQTTWNAIDQGLSDRFGFPLGLTKTGRIVVAPLTGDEDRTFSGGDAAVWYSDDGGDKWTQTLLMPGEKVYASVLRDAMDVQGDAVFLGTSMGDVFTSDSAAERFDRIGVRLPRIQVVRAGAN